MAVDLDYLNPNPRDRFCNDEDRDFIVSNDAKRLEITKVLYQLLESHLIFTEEIVRDNIDLRPKRRPDWWITQQRDNRMIDGVGQFDYVNFKERWLNDPNLRVYILFDLDRVLHMRVPAYLRFHICNQHQKLIMV